MTDPQAELRHAISATTGSARAFAVVIDSHERTVRRWLAGDRAIPGPVLQLCRLLTARPSLARLLRVSPTHDPRRDADGQPARQRQPDPRV
jgi:hypothetical protein